MELKIKNLTKTFKDKVAVDTVNMTLTSGVWGLLGANGAGKTTLMKMIADIIRPTEGEVLYGDSNIHKCGAEYRKIFGFLPQDFGCSNDFNVKDYLEYMAALKGIDRKKANNKIHDLLERLTLEEVRNQKIVKLSGGMRRRVGIAQAMLNDPEVLILDEPTAGLDPGERIRFRNFISEFGKNKIVLISTHIVSDIEYISTRNAIMKGGKLLDVGTTEELVKKIAGKVWSAIIPEKDLLVYEAKLQMVNQKNEENGKVSIRYLSENPVIDNSEQVLPRLEDLYLWLFSTESERG